MLQSTMSFIRPFQLLVFLPARLDGKGPEGVTLIPWAWGRPLLWNATVPDALAPSYSQTVISGPRAVAAQAELKKFSSTLPFPLLFALFLLPLNPWASSALALSLSCMTLAGELLSILVTDVPWSTFSSVSL